MSNLRDKYWIEFNASLREPYTCALCGESSVYFRPGSVGNCSANNGNGHLLSQNLDPKRFPLLTAKHNADN